jgi:hypothetical protein
MRMRTMTKDDAEFIRRSSAAPLNQERAEQYARDWSVMHLVTTNAEVDEVNRRYIEDFARARNKKIVIIQADQGGSLAIAEGCALTLLQNIANDHGVCNGMFCQAVGVMFGDNRSSAIGVGERPACVLVRPGDSAIDTSWTETEVRQILSQPGVTIRRGDAYHPIEQHEIDIICAALSGVVPIGYHSKCVDDDGSSKQKWRACIPLRLARAVTVHKVQGSTLDKLIFSLGTKKMPGTSLTGFTRCRGGFSALVLDKNFDDVHLIDHFNSCDNENFDLVEITKKLDRNYQRTLQRRQQGTLYSRDVVMTNVDLGQPVTVAFPRRGGRGGRGSAPAARGSGTAPRGRGQSSAEVPAGAPNRRGRASRAAAAGVPSVPRGNSGTRWRASRGRAEG